MRSRKFSKMVLKYGQRLYYFLLGLTLVMSMSFLIMQDNASTVTTNSMDLPSHNTGSLTGRRIKHTLSPQLQPPGKWSLTKEGMHEAWIRAVKAKHKSHDPISRNGIYIHYDRIPQTMDESYHKVSKANQQLQSIHSENLDAYDVQTSILENNQCDKCFKNEYELLVSNDNLCNKAQGRDILLVTFIATRILEVDRRHAIRQTWTRSSRNNTALTLRYFFILGLNPERDVPDSVLRESKAHNDIVVYDFIDTYANLTIKTMVGLSHALKVCPSSRFVLKTDSDVYVNFPSVFKLLRSYLNQTAQNQRQANFDLDYRKSLSSVKELLPFEGENLKHDTRKTVLKRVSVNNTVAIPGQVVKMEQQTATNGIFGLLWHRAIPIRNASTGLKKWIVTYEDYQESVYPDYLDGMGYILPMSVVKKVISVATKTSFFRFEDVFIGLCLEHIGIRLEKTNGFLRLDSDVTVCSHKNNNVYLVHKVSPMAMLNIWRSKCASNELVQKVHHITLEEIKLVARNLTYRSKLNS